MDDILEKKKSDARGEDIMYWNQQYSNAFPRFIWYQQIELMQKKCAPLYTICSLIYDL